MSTCHWCHVMAHESFEDEEAAVLLNRDYVSIKVDREERPDIDTVYMAVCQGLTGQGGWPLTIVMTPDRKPFFAGTYFPKEKRYNMPGLMEILNTLSKEWKDNQKQVLETADKIVDVMKKRQQTTEESGNHNFGSIKRESKDVVYLEKARVLFREAKEHFAYSFDKVYGGFGTAPKFPSAHNLMFLLRYHKYEKDEEALRMVEKTLESMYMGGIFDHIGYGFSRYSTDEKWLAPHFEKMLYDNALLAMVYAEAWQVTGRMLYRSVMEKTLEYSLTEMTGEEGGFYSAQDADSEGVEGKYYVFRPEEVISVLGENEGSAFNQHYDIGAKPNFEAGSIPNLINTFDEERDGEWEKNKKQLYSYRRERTSLHKDDKCLTSWNCLMLTAFAKAFGATENEKYLVTAEKCRAFISQNLTDQETGRLYVRYRNQHSAGEGTLDDYAFYVLALATLYEVTAKSEYLDQAVAYSRMMKELFWDEKDGGFYLTAKDAEELIYRPKETYDGAMPSGNSIAGYALVKLEKMTGDVEISDTCRRQLIFLEKSSEEFTPGHSFAMMALMMECYPDSFLCENGVCS